MSTLASIPPRPLRENADIESSSEDYARRFLGSVGRWLLEQQTRLTLHALHGLPAGASILDVGGGHAQVAPPLIEAGYEVTVVGSDPACAGRLRPWIEAGRCRFHVADLQRLPYPDAGFAAVLCYRLLPHSIDWRRLLAELCRVSALRVVVDYPSLQSVNRASEHLFGLKQRIERGTARPFALFDRAEVRRAFADSGFSVREERPQFLWPMSLHRLTRSARVARSLEWPGRVLGLTRRWGSPVIVRADRRGALGSEDTEADLT
ncbi:MAG: class I SAM-dependent methyltransferase [Gemmatimonadales bacterium]